jgi:hypothetical protein
MKGAHASRLVLKNEAHKPKFSTNSHCTKSADQRVSNPPIYADNLQVW